MFLQSYSRLLRVIRDFEFFQHSYYTAVEVNSHRCVSGFKSWNNETYRTSYFKHSNALCNSYSKAGAVSDEQVKEVLNVNALNKDVFGTLGGEYGNYKSYCNTQQEKGDRRIRLVGQKMTPLQYGKIARDLLKENKLKEALEVLFVRMKNDQVEPNDFMFNVLIGGCGRAGFTKMAFKLFAMMLKQGLRPKHVTYTGLFNSCAYSPDPGNGLKRAKHLRQLMEEKSAVPNAKNYHAMIKAFGCCGDVETAFQLADEMVANGHPLNDELATALLQACLGDKQAGFRHAFVVWRKLRRNRIRPSLHSYDLLLRIVQKCGSGDELAFNETLRLMTTSEVRPKHSLVGDTVTSLSNSSTDQDHALEMPATKVPGEVPAQIPKMVEEADDASNLPDLLAYRLSLGSVVRFENLQRPDNRYMLLGGSEGILQHMSDDRVTPSIKTFTKLMEMAPPTRMQEQYLVDKIADLGIEPDVDFFNAVIRRRAFRKDDKGVAYVLTLLQKYRLKPNIMTFGTVALTCRTIRAARNFLEEMNEAGFRPTAEIIGALVRNACVTLDLWYVIEMMDATLKHQVRPTGVTIRKLEEMLVYTKEQIVNKELGRPYNSALDSPNFADIFRVFKMRYRQWLKEAEVQVEPHPWKQYQPNVSNKSDSM